MSRLLHIQVNLSEIESSISRCRQIMVIDAAGDAIKEAINKIRGDTDITGLNLTYDGKVIGKLLIGERSTHGETSSQSEGSDKD